MEKTVLSFELDFGNSVESFNSLTSAGERLNNVISEVRNNSKTMIPSTENMYDESSQNVASTLHRMSEIDSQLKEGKLDSYQIDIKTEEFKSLATSLSSIISDIKTVQKLTENIGRQTSNYTQKQIKTFMPQLMGMARDAADLYKQTGSLASDEQIIAGIKNTSKYETIKSALLGNEKKGAESIDSILKLAVIKGVSQVQRGSFMSKLAPGTGATNIFDSFQDMLPSGFKSINTSKDFVSASNLSKAAQENKKALSAQETQKLYELLRENQFALDAAEEAGIAQRKNGRLFIQKGVSRGMVKSMGQRLFDDLVIAGKGMEMYGIENINDPDAWERISRKSNKRFTGGMAAARRLSDSYDWFQAERYAPKDYKKIYTDSLSENSSGKKTMYDAGEIKFSPRPNSYEVANYTLEDLENGRNWNDRKKYSNYEDYHHLTVDESLHLNNIMSHSKQGIKKHNSYLDDVIYLEIDPRLGDPNLDEKERQQIIDKYADVFQHGISGKGKNDANEKYVLSRINPKMGAEFVRKSIYDKIAKEDPTYFSAGLGRTEFSDWKTYASAMEYRNKNATPGKSIQKLFGSELPQNIVVVDLEDTTKGQGGAGLNGASVISNRLVQKGFQGRAHGIKTALSSVDIDKLIDTYNGELYLTSYTGDESEKQVLLDENGNAKLDKNGKEIKVGKRIKINKGTDMIVNAADLKNADARFAGMTNEEITNIVRQDIAKGIYANRLYSDANGKTRWISGQLAQTFSMDKEQSGMFARAFMDHYRKVGNYDYALEHVFGGDPYTHDLLVKNKELFGSKMIQNKIADYRQSIMARMLRGDLMLPEDTKAYKGMVAPWLIDAFNADMQTRRNGEQTTAFDALPENVQKRLNNLTLGENRALFQKTLATKLGLGRYPATGQSIQSVANANGDKAISKFAEQIGLDPYGLYISTTSPLMQLLQDADFDGDVMEIIELATKEEKGASVAKIMDKIVTATVKNNKRLYESGKISKEELSRRDKELERVRSSGSSFSTNFSTAKGARNAAMWTAAYALQSSSMGTPNATVRNAFQMSPDSEIATALIDADRQYSINSVEGKKGVGRNTSEEQRRVIGKYKPFSEFYRMVDKSRDDFGAIQPSEISKKNFFGVNLPSASMSGSMRAQNLARFIAKNVYGYDINKGYNWDEIFEMANGEINPETAVGKMQLGLKDVVKGVLNADYLAPSDTTVAQLLQLKARALEEETNRVAIERQNGLLKGKDLRRKDETIAASRIASQGGYVIDNLVSYALTQNSSALGANRDTVGQLQQLGVTNVIGKPDLSKYVQGDVVSVRALQDEAKAKRLLQRNDTLSQIATFDQEIRKDVIDKLNFSPSLFASLMKDPTEWAARYFGGKKSEITPYTHVGYAAHGAIEGFMKKRLDKASQKTTMTDDELTEATKEAVIDFEKYFSDNIGKEGLSKTDYTKLKTTSGYKNIIKYLQEDLVSLFPEKDYEVAGIEGKLGFDLGKKLKKNANGEQEDVAGEGYFDLLFRNRKTGKYVIGDMKNYSHPTAHDETMWKMQQLLYASALPAFFEHPGTGKDTSLLPDLQAGELEGIHIIQPMQRMVKEINSSPEAISENLEKAQKGVQMIQTLAENGFQMDEIMKVSKALDNMFGGNGFGKIADDHFKKEQERSEHIQTQMQSSTGEGVAAALVMHDEYNKAIESLNKVNSFVWKNDKENQDVHANRWHQQYQQVALQNGVVRDLRNSNNDVQADILENQIAISKNGLDELLPKAAVDNLKDALELLKSINNEEQASKKANSKVEEFKELKRTIESAADAYKVLDSKIESNKVQIQVKKDLLRGTEDENEKVQLKNEIEELQQQNKTYIPQARKAKTLSEQTDKEYKKYLSKTKDEVWKDLVNDKDMLKLQQSGMKVPKSATIENDMQAFIKSVKQRKADAALYAKEFGMDTESKEYKAYIADLNKMISPKSMTAFRKRTIDASLTDFELRKDSIAGSIPGMKVSDAEKIKALVAKRKSEIEQEKANIVKKYEGQKLSPEAQERYDALMNYYNSFNENDYTAYLTNEMNVDKNQKVIQDIMQLRTTTAQLEGRGLTKQERIDQTYDSLRLARDKEVMRLEKDGLTNQAKEYGNRFSDSYLKQLATDREIENQRITDERSDYQFDQMRRVENLRQLQRYGINAVPFGRTVSRVITGKNSFITQAENRKMQYESAIKEREEKLRSINPKTEKERYDKLSNEIQSFKEASAGAEKEIEQMSGPLGTAAAAAMQFGNAFGRITSMFGRRVFMRAIAEVKQFVKQFNHSLTEIQMITLKSDEQMSALGTGLIDKAKELKVSIMDITQSAATLYRQGLNDEEVSERLEVVSKFSKVSGTKVADATKLITIAMNTGLVTDPQQAADIVTALGDNAATNAQQIEKGIEKAGAAAAADGTSFAQLAAMLTAITSTTQIGGNVAGRTLNTIFGRMNKIGTNELIVDENGNMISGSAVAELLRAQGIEQYNNGKKRSSYDVLYDLSQRWDKMSDAEQQQIANAIAGTRQYSNFSAIMHGMSEGKVDEYMKLVGESEGIVDKKYDIYVKSLDASLVNLKNSFDSLIASLSDTGAITGFIDGLATMIKGVENLTSSLGGLEAALPVVMLLLGVLSGARLGAMTGGGYGALIGAGIGGLIGVGTYGITTLAGNTQSASEKKQSYISSINKAYEFRENSIGVIESLKNKENLTTEEKAQLKSALGDIAGISKIDTTSSEFKSLIDAIDNAGSSAIDASKDLNQYTEAMVKSAKESINAEKNGKLFNINYGQAVEEEIAESRKNNAGEVSFSNAEFEAFIPTPISKANQLRVKGLSETEIMEELGLKTHDELLEAASDKTYDFTSSEFLSGFRKTRTGVSKARAQSLLGGLLYKAYQNVPYEDLTDREKETHATRTKEEWEKYAGFLIDSEYQLENKVMERVNAVLNTMAATETTAGTSEAEIRRNQFKQDIGLFDSSLTNDQLDALADHAMSLVTNYTRRKFTPEDSYNRALFDIVGREADSNKIAQTLKSINYVSPEDKNATKINGIVAEAGDYVLDQKTGRQISVNQAQKDIAKYNAQHEFEIATYTAVDKNNPDHEFATFNAIDSSKEEAKNSAKGLNRAYYVDAYGRIQYKDQKGQDLETAEQAKIAGNLDYEENGEWSTDIHKFKQISPTEFAEEIETITGKNKAEVEERAYRVYQKLYDNAFQLKTKNGLSEEHYSAEGIFGARLAYNEAERIREENDREQARLDQLESTQAWYTDNITGKTIRASGWDNVQELRAQYDNRIKELENKSFLTQNGNIIGTYDNYEQALEAKQAYNRYYDQVALSENPNAEPVYYSSQLAEGTKRAWLNIANKSNGEYDSYQYLGFGKEAQDLIDRFSGLDNFYRYVDKEGNAYYGATMAELYKQYKPEEIDRQKALVDSYSSAMKEDEDVLKKYGILSSDGKTLLADWQARQAGPSYKIPKELQEEVYAARNRYESNLNLKKEAEQVYDNLLESYNNSFDKVNLEVSDAVLSVTNDTKIQAFAENIVSQWEQVQDELKEVEPADVASIWGKVPTVKDAIATNLVEFGQSIVEVLEGVNEKLAETEAPEYKVLKNYFSSGAETSYGLWKDSEKNSKNAYALHADSMLNMLMNSDYQNTSYNKGITGQYADIQKLFNYVNREGISEWGTLLQNPEFGRLMYQVKTDSAGHVIAAPENIIDQVTTFLYEYGRDYGKRQLSLSEKAQRAQVGFKGITEEGWYTSYEARQHALQPEYDKQIADFQKTLASNISEQDKQYATEYFKAHNHLRNIDDYSMYRFGNYHYLDDYTDAYLKEIIGEDLTQKSKTGLNDFQADYANTLLSNAVYGIKGLTTKDRLAKIKDIQNLSDEDFANIIATSPDIVNDYMSGFSGWSEYSMLRQKKAKGEEYDTNKLATYERDLDEYYKQKSAEEGQFSSAAGAQEYSRLKYESQNKSSLAANRIYESISNIDPNGADALSQITQSVSDTNKQDWIDLLANSTELSHKFEEMGVKFDENEINFDGIEEKGYTFEQVLTELISSVANASERFKDLYVTNAQTYEKALSFNGTESEEEAKKAYQSIVGSELTSKKSSGIQFGELDVLYEQAKLNNYANGVYGLTDQDRFTGMETVMSHIDNNGNLDLEWFNSNDASVIEDITSNYKDFFETLRTGNPDDKIEALKRLNAQFTADKAAYIAKYKKSLEGLPDILKLISKGGVDATKGQAQLRKSMNDLKNQAIALRKAQEWNGKWKSGKEIKGESDGSRTLGFLSDLLGIDATELENYTAEDMKKAFSGMQDHLNEVYGDTVQVMLEEAVNAAKLQNNGEIPIDISTFQAVVNGEVDLSNVRAAVGNTAADILEVIKTLVGNYGRISIEADENGNIVDINAVLDSTGKYTGKGSGGGGGKSKVDSLLEKQKRRVAEIEHQQKMLEIKGTQYDFYNNYGAWEKNIDKQVKAQNKLAKAYQKNISELKEMLKHTKKGSDDWYKLKDAIRAAEESLADVTNKINELNTKKIEILEQKLTNKSKHVTHRRSMLQMYAEGALEQGRFKDYEKLTQADIAAINTQKSKNDEALEEWKKKLKKAVKYSDEWYAIRDKIYELEEQNLQLDNEAAQKRLELNRQRLAQIAKVLQQNTQTATHNKNITDIYGNYYSSSGYREQYERAISSNESYNNKLLAENLKARQKAVGVMNSETPGSDEWFEAQQAVYGYDEAIAQLKIDQLELNSALAESRLQGIAEDYADATRDVVSANEALERFAEDALSRNDFDAYAEAMSKQIDNMPMLINATKVYINELKDLYAHGMSKGDLDPTRQREILDQIIEQEAKLQELTIEQDKKSRELTSARIDKVLENQSFVESNYEHNQRLLGYQASKYQSNNELTNYGTVLAVETQLRTDRVQVMQEELEVLRALYDEADEGSDQEKRVTEAIKKKEEAIASENVQIEKNNKLIEENIHKIRQLQKTLEDSVDKEIEDQKKRAKEILSANVSMQSTIVDLLKKRLTDEWNLKKKDIEKEKESLNEYKKLINERFNYRKKASQQADKDEELADYRRQLALIEADPTRTKDAKELRRKIEDLEKEKAWTIAEDELNAENERVDDQMEGMTKFVQYNEELLSQILSDANNFAEEMNEILTGSFTESYDKIMEFMRKENEAFMKSLPDAQQQMIEGWTETWKKANDIIDNNYNQIKEILDIYDEFGNLKSYDELANGGYKERYLNWMRQNDRTYRSYYDAGDQNNMLIMEKTWSDYFDNFLNSIKTGAVVEIDDHALRAVESKIDELKDNIYQVNIVDIDKDTIGIYGLDNSTQSTIDQSTGVVPSIDNYTDVGTKKPKSTSGSSSGSSSGDGSGGSGGSKTNNAPDKKETKWQARVGYDDSMNQSHMVIGEGIAENDWTAREKALGDAKSKMVNSIRMYEPMYSKVYKLGGNVDYTGYAWVDGTKTRPEAFLGADDRESMRAMLDSINYIRTNPYMSQVDASNFANNTEVGDINIVINQAEIKSDTDINKLARQVGKAFSRELQNNGLNLSGYSFA